MKKIIKKILDICGYKITRKQTSTIEFHKDHLLDNFWSVLHKISYKPSTVIDIGANTGTWTFKVHEFFPEAKIIMVEPQIELKEAYKDFVEKNNITFLPIGIGKEDGMFLFTRHHRDDSSSFLYSEEDAKKNHLKQEKIQVRSLNSLVESNEIAIPDIVKIDAEGLDLDVLKGATLLFGQTEIFMIEAAVRNKIYPNSLLALITFMDQNGYELYDFTDLNRPLDVPILWLVEVVFVRKNGTLATYEKKYDTSH